MNSLIKKTFNDIKTLKIQGATDVAKEIILALGEYGQKIEEEGIKDWEEKIKEAANYLLSARPTEPMAQNGVGFIFSELKKKDYKNIIQAKNYLKKIIKDFLIVIDDAGELIISHGQKIIKEEDDNIFTHCHSWLVEQILKRAKENKKNFEVFNTETRPLFQGRITAQELLKANIPTTMVVDSSAGFLISHYSGKELMIDKIILGADAILPDGSIINKIGSFTVSLVAYNEKVPLYIAASLLKYHSNSWIKIEKRKPQEIWKKAPKKLDLINFAFDKVPEKYITGIICEAGIIKPEEVKNKIKEIYPFI